MADGVPDDFSKDELLRRIENRWQKLNDLLGALTRDDWERPLGDGWPVKVHVAHLADWERSMIGILERRSRAEAMNIPADLWEAHDTDAINEFMAERAMLMPAEACREALDQSHARVIALLSSLDEPALLLPYSQYQPGGQSNDNPVVGWVVGNTFGHYDEHIEWLEQGLTA